MVAINAMGRDRRRTTAQLLRGASSIASAPLLDRFYQRVLGCLYQALGDAEIAVQATTDVFMAVAADASDAQVWTSMLDTLERYVARGYAVTPLPMPEMGWQSRVLRALGRLEPRDRALLLLRYHEHLPPDMLARIWRISETELRLRVAAARNHLLEIQRTL